MHKQQQGESPAELLAAAAASSSSGDHSQRSQKLKIADSSAEVLQHLGLSSHQGEHYCTLISDAELGLIDCYGCQDLIEATVCNLHRIYDASNCIPAISSNNSSNSDVIQFEANLLPVLLQLAAQLPLLEKLVQLLTLMETVCSKVREFGRPFSNQGPSAAAAAVAELGDSIFAPLVLQVGPAVLHVLQKPGDNQKIKTAAAVKWSAVVQLIVYFKSISGMPWTQERNSKCLYCPVQVERAYDWHNPIMALGESLMFESLMFDASGTDHLSQHGASAAALLHHHLPLNADGLLKWGDWNTWDDVVQQQPYTATSAAEVAFRAAAAADSRFSYVMLQMTSCLFASVTKSTRELLEAGPVAANYSSNTKCLQCYTSNSMAAKPFSLIITGIKFIQQYAKSAESQERILAVFNGALGALGAAQCFANAAAGTAAEGAYIASRTSGVAAIPWMHAASHVLHCCSQTLLYLSVIEASASHDDTARATVYTMFMTMLVRLIEPVQWCRELPVLLVDPSSYNGTGSSTCAREGPLAGVVPAKVLHKLHQQLTKTQLMLQEGTREVSEVMDQAPGSRAALTMQWGKEVRTVSNKLSQQLQQNAAVLSAVFPTLLCCNNPGCSNMSGASELACVGSSKCSKCKAAGYCSRECQAEHWSQHKMVCSKIAAK